MSSPSTTIATLPRITREELSEQLIQSQESQTPQSPASAPQKGSGSIAIIDVRDSDHIGGHIRGSTHVPSSTLDYRVPDLVRTLKDKETVVFHCALSQQRGPSAALQYVRERERLTGLDVKLKKPNEEGGDKQIVEDKGDGDGEGGKEGSTADGKGVQKVLVLEGGFTKWQEVYGEDKRLTEAYDKGIWEFGGS